jgi:GT2 family glycosyltransferase
LEKLFDVYLEDKNADIGAVGGVYLDPKRHEKEQMAPAGFETNIDYAGKIDHNVPWPYICPYPDGTKPRLVEHLYSSFMYRVEAAVAVGGYCRRFSQIGHREESDFSYRFHLGGWKLLIQPSAIGFHFCAPAGGIRSNSITEKNKLAEGDHKIYQRRVTRWKKRAELRKIRDAEKAKELPAPLPKTDVVEVVEKPKNQPKVAIVISGGNDLPTISRAVCRFGEYSDDVYVTCENPAAKDDLQSIKYLKMIASTPEEVALLTKQLLAEGDHEFIMTVTDLMYFESNPLALINDSYDDYVFEIFRTYENANQRVVGPECQNACIITRRRENAKPRIERILYCEMPVIEDNKLKPTNGKSLMGKDLIAIEDMSRKNWTKICTYQYPEGRLIQPRQANVIKTETLVSIIIPTAGRRQVLKRCLDSIYSHTTTPFEIIIIDNDSQDGTAEYLVNEAKIRGNLKVFSQSVNHGYQKAVNIGLGKAKGEFILLFNDDAWVTGRETDGRDWLQVYIDELTANPKLGLIGPHGCESPALGTRILFFWCVMFRKSLYEQVGPLDDIAFWNYGGDDDYCQRIRNAGFEIKELITNLRHDMNHVPDYVKKPELEESVLKLRAKYKKS